MAFPPYIAPTNTDVVLRVYVQPGAKKTEVSGLYDDRLKIRVQAPPAAGKANKELCRFLARLLGIPKNRVAITRGEKNRRKDITLREISPNKCTLL